MKKPYKIEDWIGFNKPYLTGKEIEYIADVCAQGQLAGDGLFTKRCNSWLEKTIGSHKALLTHSCTAALEIMAILADTQPGDEIIMPSYTFVSVANAFALRGCIPVFVEIRPDTMNIDENLIEDAITPRTKAIVAVHYAGVACEMDAILDIASRHDLLVFEDAAQGIMSTYKDRPLGSIGDLGTLSFHETKNIISGEGGVLLINNDKFIERAEIIREKGTDRSKFFRGQVDKYSWIDIGSSYLPGEIIAAFLWAQLDEAESINGRNLKLWNIYHEAFESLEQSGDLRRPIVPSDCKHQGHIYYLLLNNLKERTLFIEYMKDRGVGCVFHYIPLHSSLAGKKYGRVNGSMKVTNNLSNMLVRLPLWIGMNQDKVIESVISFFKK